MRCARNKSSFIAHPRFLTRCGPITRVTPSGRRFQILMKRWYFGLSGFTSGTRLALTSTYSLCCGSGSKPQFFLKLYEPVSRLLWLLSITRTPRSAERRMSSQYMKSLPFTSCVCVVPLFFLGWFLSWFFLFLLLVFLCL